MLAKQGRHGLVDVAVASVFTYSPAPQVTAAAVDADVDVLVDAVGSAST